MPPEQNPIPKVEKRWIKYVLIALGILIISLGFYFYTSQSPRESVSGVDADNDGVRDDFQLYLENRFIDNLDAKSAGRQYATAMQRLILSPSNTDANELAEGVLAANYCMASILGVREAYALKDEFHEEFLNTRERENLYGDFQLRLKGAQFGSPQLDELSQFCKPDLIDNLPPDPGEAGKATLEGIDSDNDGVRDDLQRWIILNYPNSAKIREALRQSAIATQRAFIATGEEERRKVLAEELAAVRCLTYVSNPTISHEITTTFDEQIVNTPLRISVYDAFSRSLHPSWFDAPRLTELKQFCNFNPDTLPN